MPRLAGRMYPPRHRLRAPRERETTEARTSSRVRLPVCPAGRDGWGCGKAFAANNLSRADGSLAHCAIFPAVSTNPDTQRYETFKYARPVRARFGMTDVNPGGLR